MSQKCWSFRCRTSSLLHAEIKLKMEGEVVSRVVIPVVKVSTGAKVKG
jgi:hypothetical protein